MKKVIFLIIAAAGFSADLYIVGSEPLGDEAAVGADYPAIYVQRAGDYSVFWQLGWDPNNGSGYDFVPTNHIKLIAGTYVFTRWDVINGYTTAVSPGGTPAWPSAPFTVREDDIVYWVHNSTGSTICISRAGGDVPATVEVPVVGTVTMPAWTVNSPEAAAFFIGLLFGAGVLLLRAALRWFKKAGIETHT